MAWAWAFLLCLAAAAAGSPLGDADGLRVDSAGRLVDRHGRARFFHGMNVVYKEWPWLPAGGAFDANASLNDGDMELLRSWGFNMVRLGVMWPAVEPEKGRISRSYLEAVSGLTKALATRGIHTLLDLHQDLGSRRFCGEGFPEFYVDELLGDPGSTLSKAKAFPFPLQMHPMPANESGFPALEACLKTEFGLYYATEKVGALWKSLYERGSSLNSGIARYWKAVAEIFRARPEIMGYELLNEPSDVCLEGTLTSCVHSAVDKRSEERYLVPLYQDLAASIRAVDGETPIFYEPFPVPKPWRPYFAEPPLGNDSQQVLAHHVYCGGLPVPCEMVQDLYMEKMADFTAKHTGIGSFMSEFGAIGESDEEISQVDRLLNLADKHLQSWAYWELKLFRDFTTENAAESLYDNSGRLEERKLKLLSRTYAQAVAGEPRRMEFKAATGDFDLEFVAAASQAAPTEIFLNEALHYPSGFEAQVQPPHCFEARSAGTNRLHLIAVGADGAWPCAGKLVSVHIQRRAGAVPVALVV